MSLETIEQHKELSVSERRKLVIATARERLIQLPDTTVSFKIKSPNQTTLSYRFTNDEGDFCDIECSTDSLRVNKTNERWPTSMEAIDISPRDYSYLNWPERLIFRGDQNNGDSGNAMEEVEARIETFLPQIEKVK